MTPAAIPTGTATSGNATPGGATPGSARRGNAGRPARRWPGRRVVLVALLVAVAVLSALWQPWPPDQIDLETRHAAPSLAHLLGTDNIGRDMLARVMVGAWRTLAVLAIVSGVGFLGGTLVGVGAALLGGVGERLVLRAVEMFIVLPTLVWALVATALFGLSPVTAGLALGLAGVGPYALLANSLARQSLAKPFVLAARAMGVGTGGLLRRHILPDLSPVLLTHIGNSAGTTILSYAALAFLGLGADTSRPDWGAMLFEYRGFIFDNFALVLWPGVAIAITAAALNLTFDRDTASP